MGLNFYKVEYDCDVMHEAYGCCDKKSAFILVLARSTDYWQLFHRTHNEELMSIESFSDHQISALKKVFDLSNDGAEITDKEFSEIKEKLFKP